MITLHFETYLRNLNISMDQDLITLGAETFANFANFAQIRESLRREKFYIDRFAKVYAREIFSFFLQSCWLPLILL